LSLWLLALPLVLAFPALASGFVVWLMGVALHYATRDGRQVSIGRARLALVVSALAVLGGLVVSRSGALPAPWPDLALGLAFSACLWALMQVRPRFPALLRFFARYGSGASFSLYLSHFPLVALLVAAYDAPSRLQPGAQAFGLFAAIALLAWAYGRAFAFATEDRTNLVRRWLKARVIPA
jgi:peptidoglycan/LPS O-acetylase OafA/YrhL